MESELFPELSRKFQRRIRTIEDNNPTWFDYYNLGVALYEYGKALWQVFGKRRFVGRQEAHMNMASMAFNWAVKVTDRDTWSNPTHQAAVRDQAEGMRVVVDASWARLYDDADQRADTRTLITELTGEPNGIVGRCKKRAMKHPEHLHQSAVVHGLAYYLSCGRTFGFLVDSSTEKLEEFRTMALRQFEQERTASPDQERAYRELLLDIGLATPQLGRVFAGIALRSAKYFGDSDHAMRARLIRHLGAFGNRAAYALLLLRRPCG